MGGNFGAAATTDTIVDGAAPSARMRRAGSGARTSSIAPGSGEAKTNGGHFVEQLFGGDSSSGGVRYRAPSQEVTHIGTIPKRTESLYLKHPIATDSKGTVSCRVLIQK